MKDKREALKRLTRLSENMGLYQYELTGKMPKAKVLFVSSTQIDEDYLQDLLFLLPEENKAEVEALLRNNEGLSAYLARVSSNDPLNTKYAGLLKYCAKNKHWSVFEMIDATFEVETSRAISAQILRHKSFNFQELSQRYQSLSKDDVIFYEARRQDDKNRQNSIDDLSKEDKDWFLKAQQEVWNKSYELYAQALSKGVAKECARFLLPLNTKTTLYVKGNLRSFIHYIELRSANGTQEEHKEIANAMKLELKLKFPVIAEAMEW